MVDRAHYLKVAQQLKNALDGKAFLSKPRMQITELLREASGEDTFGSRTSLPTTWKSSCSGKAFASFLRSRTPRRGTSFDCSRPERP